MLKRSLLVLVLLAAGVAIGVLATGALKVRDSLARAEGARADERPAPSVPASASRAPEPEPAPVAEPPRQDPPAANGGLRFAVVNLKNCFDEQNYEYAREVTAQLKALDESNQRKLQGIESEMRELENKMKAVQRGSTLWQDFLRKAKVLEQQYKIEKDFARLTFTAEYSEKKMEVYKEIRRCIDIYGRDRKYDFIFRVEEPQLDEDMPQYASQQIAQRVVLYHGDAFDVTKDVLKLLNAEWQKKKASQPKPPDPPPALTGICPDAKCGTKTSDAKCPRCGKEIPKK